MYRIVEIGRNVNGEKLERVLVETAQKMGFRAVSKDDYRTDYRLGSLHEKQTYEETRINLSGRVLPFAEITHVMKDSGNTWFSIQTGINSGFLRFSFGSKKRIEDYLSAVSEALAEAA